MLNERCRCFREEFEPGRPDSHLEACPSCAEWAAEVIGLRGAGANSPLPAELRGKLRAIGPAAARSGEGARVSGDGASVLGPIPQIPVPARLNARLRSIPTGRRDAPLPAWVFRSRDLLAAACLLALLLTAAVGAPPSGTLETAASVSRDVALGVQEAGVLGTRTLLEAGDFLSHGIEFLNKSMGSLMGRLGPRRTSTDEPAAGKAPPAKGHPKEDKEKSHGKRTEPRGGAPRG